MEGCAATSTDVSGPLDDEADARPGVGSGFVLAGDSAAVDGAAPSNVSVDATGIQRDDMPDGGAYELER